MAEAGSKWLIRARAPQLFFDYEWRDLIVEQPRTLMVLGGRGSGKTRMGAEWVNALVHGHEPWGRLRHGRIALVGESLADVREVMVEGPSGVMASARGRAGLPRFETVRRRVVWPNGAVGMVFSSEDPESLRGPQFDAAWCDELGKWKHADATWDMLQFGLRLGQRPRQIVTTTPRVTPLMKRLLAGPDTVTRQMATADNAANLARGFVAEMETLYGRTHLGRQELLGELIEDREGGLWTRERIEKAAAMAVGDLRRIVVAVDPPASSGKNSDACGIVAAGVDASGRGVVLADATVRQASPSEWAARAIALYRRLEADCIVAETNQGGEMVASVLRAVDATVPIKQVRASRGKWVRAEPVAALYDQDRVAHARRFPELEDEMCDFGPDGLSDGRSPDRVDALVWALTELMLARRAEPRVRGV